MVDWNHYTAEIFAQTLSQVLTNIQNAKKKKETNGTKKLGFSLFWLVMQVLLQRHDKKYT